MILPTKHLPPDRSLIFLASEISSLVGRNSTVSSLWNDLKKRHKSELRLGEVPYDWFVLSLDLLYLMGLIEEQDGLIRKTKRNAP
ncbi:MAG: ABC-three component system middle component 6 [Pseudomonadota bacterium]